MHNQQDSQHAGQWPARRDGCRPVALITGAANNIGLACAARFAAGGCAVVAGDIADASASAGRLSNVTPVRLDVTDEQSCREAVEMCGRLGPLTALVHCAGITMPARSVQETTVEEWERVIRVDLTGSFIIARACIAAMSQESGASMTLFSSRAAKSGFAALGSNAGRTKAAYCAAKAGVIALVKSLATELAGAGIRVNGIAPGPVEGSMLPREQWASIAARVPLHRLGTPENMADAAWFLASEQASFITGHILDVNGGTLMD